MNILQIWIDNFAELKTDSFKLEIEETGKIEQREVDDIVKNASKKVMMGDFGEKRLLNYKRSKKLLQRSKTDFSKSSNN